MRYLRIFATSTEVVSGMDVIKKVEESPTGAQDRPQKETTIASSGEL